MVRANKDLIMTGETADHYAPNVCMYGVVWCGMV